MIKSHFLWPESRVFRALVSAPKLVPVSTVEETIREIFPTGYPVLCSSGRAALAIALIQSKVLRSDLVGVFPYASHCVLDTISRIATPLAGPTAETAPLRIVYHQWGYVQEMNLPSNAIEDCVDTLCIPGATLFPGGGRFEIWSLPKILGTSSGSVLWCRDQETAEASKVIRDKRGGGLLLWMLRLLSKRYPSVHLYWQGAEANMGGVSNLQTGEILSAVLNWELFVFDRIRKMNMIWPHAVDWLKMPVDRFPPVVPVPLVLSEELAHGLGISSRYRMFERFDSSGNRSLEQVLPIPIHQDVSESWLTTIKKLINDRENLLYGPNVHR